MADWREIIKENMNMKNLNTLKLEAIAKYYAQPENIEILKHCLEFAKKNRLKILILGNGSNIVFSRSFYDNLLVIDMKKFNKIEISDEKIVAQAGVKSSMLINFCINNEISGFEFLAGIPGTVGGMIKMNAGAFGKNISDNLLSVKVLDLENFKEIKMDKNSLKFEYRALKGLENKIIIEAEFKFLNDKRENIKNKIRNYILERKKKQPSGYSAGSIFKNPKGNYAGKLIEECNLKGFNINDAYISEKHGNFIINKGNAKGDDVLKIIKFIKDKVLKKKGIELVEEVIIV